MQVSPTSSRAGSFRMGECLQRLGTFERVEHAPLDSVGHSDARPLSMGEAALLRHPLHPLFSQPHPQRLDFILSAALHPNAGVQPDSRAGDGGEPACA